MDAVFTLPGRESPATIAPSLRDGLVHYESLLTPQQALAYDSPRGPRVRFTNDQLKMEIRLPAAEQVAVDAP